MNINATLIIQACNFFIAYLLLRVLFLKPAVIVLKQEKAQLDGLVSQLSEKRKAIVLLEQTKKEQWHAAQEQFRTNFPDVVSRELYFFQHLTPERNIVCADDHTVKQIENELVAYIAQKVDHARS